MLYEPTSYDRAQLQQGKSLSHLLQNYRWTEEELLVASPRFELSDWRTLAKHRVLEPSLIDLVLPLLHVTHLLNQPFVPETHLWEHCTKTDWLGVIKRRKLSSSTWERLIEAGTCPAAVAYGYGQVGWDAVTAQLPANIRELITTASLTTAQLDELLTNYPDPQLADTYVGYQQLGDELVLKHLNLLRCTGLVRRRLTTATWTQILDRVPRSLQRHYLRNLIREGGLNVDAVYEWEQYLELLERGDLDNIIKDHKLDEGWLTRHASLWERPQWELIARYQVLSIGFINRFRMKFRRNEGWLYIARYQPLTYEWITANVNSLNLRIVLSNRNLKISAAEREALEVLHTLQ